MDLENDGLVDLAFMERLGARMLLVAPGITTGNKKLLGTKGIATRSKDATNGALLALLTSSGWVGDASRVQGCPG